MLAYETYWPAALFIYCIIVFIFAFALRSLLVYRRSGVNPLVLPLTDDAYGYVALAFKVVIVGIGVVVIGLAIWPDSQTYFGRWTALSSPALAYVGWAVLIASLIWLLIAQVQMGASWRIGIDAKRRTELALEDAVSTMRPPTVRIDACGDGTARAQRAAAHRFRNLYLDLRVVETNAPSCQAAVTPRAVPVTQRTGQRPFGIYDEAVDRWWNNVMP